MNLAQQRREVCLGIKIQSEETNAEQNFGIDLIPEKDQIIRMMANDSLVVLSEDEF